MPIVELALLIQLGQRIGFWPTLGLIVATGVTGSYLARREGLSVWRRFNERLQAGDLPGTELVDGLIVLIAGALLITPGVVTDFLGFIGLIPLTRRPIRHLILKRLKKKMAEGTMRVSVGGFGVASPPDASERSPSEAETSWQGAGRRTPRHTHDPDASPGDSDDRDARPGS